MMKRIFLFLCLFCLIAAAAVGEEEPAPRLLVMLYMTGSNLETDAGAATKDLEEIMAALPEDSSVEVIALLAGSKAWHNGVSPEENTIYRIRRGGMEKIKTTPLQSMGDTETLKDFLWYVYEHCPAEQYALIFWDHGAGPVLGLCFDEQFLKGQNIDSLTLEELRLALDGSPFSQRKLSWIGFDACLMASMEMACAVAPYADYMIASQELEGSDGWNYAFLKQAGRQEAAETAERIVDAYMEGRQNKIASAALSVVDLAKIDGAARAMDAFFQNVTLDSVQYTAFARSRVDAKATAWGAPMDYDLIDLMDFLNELENSGAADCGELMVSLREAVVYNRTNSPFLNGLNIYFPFYNQSDYISPWSGLYRSTGAPEGYLDFLNQFTEIWMGNALADWYNKDTPQQQLRDGKTYLTMQLTKEQASQVARARLVVLSDYRYKRLVPVYTSQDVELSEDGLLTVVYQDEALFMADAQGVPLTDAIGYEILDDGLGLYGFLERGSYTDGNYDYTNAYLVYRKGGNGSYQLAHAYPVKEEIGNIGKEDLNLEEWDTIQFQFSYRIKTYDVDGGLLPFEQWEEGVMGMGELVRITPDMHPVFMQLQDQKKRYAYLEVTDLQNNTINSELFALENPNRHEVGAGNVTILDNEYASLALDRLEFWTGETPFIRQCITAVNRTDDWLYITPTDVSLDAVWTQEKLPQLSLSPRAVLPFELKLYVYDMQDFHLAYWNAIHCTLEGKNNLGSLFRKEASIPVQVDLRSLTPQLSDDPIFCTQWENLRIGLISLERDDSDWLGSYLYFVLRLENTGGQTMGYAMDSLRINGLDAEWALMQTPTGEQIKKGTLPGGMTTYVKVSVDTDKWNSETQQIENRLKNIPISSVTLYIGNEATQPLEIGMFSQRESVTLLLPEPVWLQDVPKTKVFHYWLYEADYDY